MRAAVLAAACLVGITTVATAETPEHTLPVGSAVVFVSDGHLEPNARTGSTLRLHLRDALVLDGVTVAAAGTSARLILERSLKPAPGEHDTIIIEDFRTAFGLLPVRPQHAQAPVLDVGTVVGAVTLAKVAHLADRFSIEVPFPFSLSRDVPAAAYTPTPVRTPSAKSLNRVTPVPATPIPPTAEPTMVPSGDSRTSRP